MYDLKKDSVMCVSWPGTCAGVDSNPTLVRLSEPGQCNDINLFRLPGQLTHILAIIGRNPNPYRINFFEPITV